MAKAYKHNDEISIVNEDNSAMRFYSSQEDQELQRLKENIGRTASEKFHRLMGLMKVGRMTKRAIIHHKI
jgi:hypothetical protein